MAKGMFDSFRRLFFSALKHPAAGLVVGFAAVNVAIAFFALPFFGFDTTDLYTWKLASRQVVPVPSNYTPLPSLLTQWWQVLFGTSSYSSFLLHFGLYGLGLASITLVTFKIFRARSVSLLTAYLTILSPYLAWSVFVGRDVAFDIFGVGLLMLFATRIYVEDPHPVVNWMGFALAAALATSLRESNFVLFLFMMVTLAICGKLVVRRAVLAIALFAVGLFPLLAWNYVHTGKVLLTSGLGKNLYLGNHPYYLAGHPSYDIDGFLEYRSALELPELGVGDGPIERNRTYQKLAWRSIKADPVAAVYRSVLKVYWWVGLTRIPGSDVSATLGPVESVVVLGSSQSTIKEFAYFLHRLLVLLGILAYWISSNDKRL